MIDWRVMLEGDVFDLEFLRDQFQLGRFRVEREGEEYQLVAAEFSQFTDHSAVFDQAEDVLTLVNGVATAVDRAHRPVRIDSLRYTDPNGKTHNFKSLRGTVEARSRASAVLTFAGQTPAPATPQSNSHESRICYGEMAQLCPDR
jgi:hypothetical protein